MRIVWTGFLVLALGGVASADRDATRKAIAEAFRKRDIAALTALSHTQVSLFDLWFDTKPCQRFMGRMRVEAADLPALFGCLADLDVRSAGPATDYLIYGPGVPLSFRINKAGQLAAIGSMAGRDAKAGDPPVVPPDLFSANVIGHSRVVVPAAKLRAEIDASADLVALAVLRVCANAKGKLDKVDVVRTSDGHATYGVHAAKALRRWKVKPFTSRGKPTRVCSLQHVGYPEDRLDLRVDLSIAPAPPPPPPPAGALPPPSGDRPQNVAPTMLECYRRRPE